MNPEDAIERVMTGLASADAPAGIEQRVLDALQERAVEKHASIFTRLSAFMRMQTWAVAAGVVVLAIAVSLAVRKRQEPRHEDAVLKLNVPHQAAAATTSLVARTPREPKLHPPASPVVRQIRSDAPEDINDLDAMAVIEMNAPSRPAPPLPLTHQEKLLATAVDHAGPEKLSTLRPEVLAQQMELSKAEFHDFFEPPPAKGNE